MVKRAGIGDVNREGLGWTIAPPTRDRARLCAGQGKREIVARGGCACNKGRIPHVVGGYCGVAR